MRSYSAQRRGRNGIALVMRGDVLFILDDLRWGKSRVGRRRISVGTFHRRKRKTRLGKRERKTQHVGGGVVVVSARLGRRERRPHRGRTGYELRNGRDRRRRVHLGGDRQGRVHLVGDRSFDILGVLLASRLTSIPPRFRGIFIFGVVADGF